MPRRRSRVRSASNDFPAQFPSLELEAERARRDFDIDIEASFRAFVLQMLGSETAVKLLREQIVRATPLGYQDELGIDLSPREREVLTLAACGYTRVEIAELLVISPETAASHLKHSHDKLRTKRVSHATVIALLVGELDIALMRQHLFRNWGDL
jgi:DNA-binding CsgD family transcriptional regulator